MKQFISTVIPSLLCVNWLSLCKIKLAQNSLVCKNLKVKNNSTRYSVSVQWLSVQEFKTTELPYFLKFIRTDRPWQIVLTRSDSAG